MSAENVKFLLNWNRFGEHLAACMSKLLTDTSHSDILIATSDKHMIYSHRFVLENSSKYFQRLLKNIKKQRGIQLVVALPEITYDIFKILMNYMYKGETQVPHELLPSVIKAGQILEINGLVNLENDDNSHTSNLIAFNSHEDHLRCAVRPPDLNSMEHREGMIPSTSRGPYSNVSNVQRQEMVKRFHEYEFRNRSVSEIGNTNNIVETITIEEDERANKIKLLKSFTLKNMTHEEQNLLHQHLKRKAATVLRKTLPSGSEPFESPSKKYLKRTSGEMAPTNSISTNTDVSFSQDYDYMPVKVKKEKESENENENENENEIDAPVVTEPFENVQIKTETPDEIEGIPYNPLQCEYCFESYNNPSDWVKHMTERHEDRGYKACNDESVNNAVITCVVCSCVLFSEAEWARHLRIWHADGDLDPTNFTVFKKT